MHRSLERFVELLYLAVEGLQLGLDPFHLLGEQLAGQAIVVVELEKLLAFIEQLGAVSAQPLVVSREVKLAFTEGLLNKFPEFGDFRRSERHLFIEALDGLFHCAYVQVTLDAVVAVFVPAKAEEVLVDAAAALGDLHAVAGAAA